MAVEAHHLNLFSPQLITTNRQMMNPYDANINLYNNTNQMGYSSLLPLSGTTSTAATENILRPQYNNTFINADSIPMKTAMKSDSSLTYNVPLPRKRSRENSNSINYPYLSSYPATAAAGATTQHHHINKSTCGSFSFLGEDLSFQIHQQQLDINNLIAERMEKVRMEIEEKRKRQARKIMEAIEVGVMKRMKAKEDEIEKIGKLNWELEERVKSLCIENQIWRDLAQTNEATANALRTELEQVLFQRADGGAAAEEVMDDASSCCGSTDGGYNDGTDDNNDDVSKKEDSEGVWRTLTGCAGVKDKENGILGNASRNNNCNRLCRNCGKEESCVLILPCRHLCLCTICGSTLHTCPICKSFKTASVHINMS
ncbi:hypothetical protein RIF29_38719 [Crotalaria pallida]|uniref:RING-type domain-containing protein n=1 Tax=Crotalaria pallida TaxID=3830 RepID=A0AAN9E0R4_CROPI